MASDISVHAKSIKSAVSSAEQQLSMMKNAVGSFGDKKDENRRHTMGTLNQVKLKKAARRALTQAAVEATKERVIELHEKAMEEKEKSGLLPPINVDVAVRRAVEDELDRPSPLSSPTPKTSKTTLSPISAS